MAVFLSAAQVVAPATAQSGLPLAVSIALGVTAVVALGMVVTELRRTSRLTAIAGGIGAASAAAIITVTAVAAIVFVDTTPEPASAVVPIEVTDYALNNFQLETLPAD